MGNRLSPRVRAQQVSPQFQKREGSFWKRCCAGGAVPAPENPTRPSRHEQRSRLSAATGRAPLSRGGEVSPGQGVGEEHKTHPEGLRRLGALGCGLKRSTGDA